jgi:hypothetical protein
MSVAAKEVARSTSMLQVSDESATDKAATNLLNSIPSFHQHEKERLLPLIRKMITNLKHFDYNLLLMNYCPLTAEYKNLRKELKTHLNCDRKDTTSFYDKCYQSTSPYEAVTRTI